MAVEYLEVPASAFTFDFVAVGRPISGTARPKDGEPGTWFIEIETGAPLPDERIFRLRQHVTPVVPHGATVVNTKTGTIIFIIEPVR